MLVRDPGTGIVLDVNEAAVLLYGYAREEFLTLCVEDLSAPFASTADPDRAAEPVFRHRKSDGTEIFVELTASLLASGTKAVELVVVRDVTAQLSDVEALRKSERDVSRVLDTIREGVFVLDSQWRFTYVNPHGELLLRRKREELIGRCIWEVFPEAVGTTFDHQYHRALREQAFVAFEEYYPPFDGWFDVRVSPSPEGLSIFFIDVTERKRSEAAIRESEVRYRLLAEYSTDVITRLTPDCVFLYMSPSSRTLLGYAPEELIGQTPFAFVHPDDLPQAESAHRAIVASESAQLFTVRFRRRDGVYLWLENEARAVRDAASGELLEIQCSSRDVTARRQAEESLRLSEERLQSILDNSKAVAYLKDTEGRYLLINRQWAELFHVTKEGVVGKTDHDLFPIEIAEAFRANDRKVIELGQMLELEEIAPHADGPHTYLSIKAPLFDEHGAPYAVCGISTDITERVVAEREIRRLNEQLETRLNRIAALHRIDLAIVSGQERNRVLDMMIDEVIAQLGIDAADILVFDKSGAELEFAAGRGFGDLATGESLDGLAAALRDCGGAALHVPVLSGWLESDARVPRLREAGFVAYHAVPLVAKGRVLGVLECHSRRPVSTEPEWLEFAMTLAGQAAVSIDNATLLDELLQSNADLAAAYDATIEGLSRALDLRDHETEGHSRRVTEMSVRLAQVMGIDDDDVLVQIRRGALLHDIGKMGIPDRILHKPGPLDEGEWAIMREHPRYAVEMLSPIEFLRPALEIPYCHHERWDGCGYPRGLSGEQIPLAARIFAAVDVWDALSSDRPYRRAWPREKVASYVRSLAGTHLDPRVVEAFLGPAADPAPELAASAGGSSSRDGEGDGAVDREEIVPAPPQTVTVPRPRRALSEREVIEQRILQSYGPDTRAAREPEPGDGPLSSLEPLSIGIVGDGLEAHRLADALGTLGHKVAMARDVDAVLSCSERLADILLVDATGPNSPARRLCGALGGRPDRDQVYVVAIVAGKGGDGRIEAFCAGADDSWTETEDPREIATRLDFIRRVMSLRQRMTELATRAEQTSTELRRQNERLAELVATDQLTGLYNRRRLLEGLAEFSSRAAEDGATLSAVMIDVDHFKPFNDEFGHQKGDDVLRRIALTLADSVRRDDLVARYGGEEFAILLPRTDAPTARMLAERLRAAVESSPWPDRPVTVSVGVATLAAPCDARRLIDEADQALYRSKRLGRNRVSHAGDPTRPETHPRSLNQDLRTIGPADAVA
jgi:diguanylate cyclase (GGDEF)-like protein/PAS domain S-box-containing protein